MSLALYRRYRPETFAEVIGQEHVTDPLQQALRERPGQPRVPVLRPARLRQDDQRAHPRPLPELRAGPDRRPRAACASPASTWRAAARAASTSSRSTRPRTAASTTPATCASGRSSRPPASRYKIYIIDEAHMVTHAGLQRAAEARRGAAASTSSSSSRRPSPRRSSARSARGRTTTRSGWCRPARCCGYLGELCDGEGVPVEDGVLPLVVRAGGGLGRATPCRARPADRRRRRRTA